MNLTEDQILTLAPDESSKKAGKDLATSSKWVTKGKRNEAVWGECQGSGSKPYQTAIDLTNIAFKCSCPSRKFPCKHGIALGLLFARNASDFSIGEYPPWVTEWLSKRTQKEEKKAEVKDKVVDEAAQAKRRQAREQKVSDGIEELLRWIKDIVRNGLLNLPEKNYAYWDGMAKRMVDAQAPGLANMVRSLGATPFYKEGWQSLFLDNLLNLYLVAKGYQNRENLSPLLLQDIRSWIGFTVNQDEAKESKGVMDTWLVVGKQVTEDDNLTTEKAWLYGAVTKQYALILQFVIRGQGASVLLSPGMCVDAELVYYPSATPLRALLKRQTVSNAKPQVKFYSSWHEVAEAETALCAAFPVRSERPYAIEDLTPVKYNNRWWLKDKQHNMILVKENFANIWSLLSLSGGYPVNTIVLGKEKEFEPLGIWINQTYKPL